jgi:hypothetical protein
MQLREEADRLLQNRRQFLIASNANLGQLIHPNTNSV